MAETLHWWVDGAGECGPWLCGCPLCVYVWLRAPPRCRTFERLPNRAAPAGSTTCSFTSRRAACSSPRGWWPSGATTSASLCRGRRSRPPTKRVRAWGGCLQGRAFGHGGGRWALGRGRAQLQQGVWRAGGQARARQGTTSHTRLPQPHTQALTRPTACCAPSRMARWVPSGTSVAPTSTGGWLGHSGAPRPGAGVCTALPQPPPPSAECVALLAAPAPATHAPAGTTRGWSRGPRNSARAFERMT